jgi:hypothetical protein
MDSSSQVNSSIPKATFEHVLPIPDPFSMGSLMLCRGEFDRRGHPFGSRASSNAQGKEQWRKHRPGQPRNRSDANTRQCARNRTDPERTFFEKWIVEPGAAMD